jgi:hypothetical protein
VRASVHQSSIVEIGRSEMRLPGTVELPLNEGSLAVETDRGGKRAGSLRFGPCPVLSLFADPPPLNPPVIQRRENSVTFECAGD